MAEYRDAAQKLTLAGYDLAAPGHVISDISQRLEAIDTVRKSERDLAAEYRTLLQVRRYVKLANEPKFVRGPKWEEVQPENTRFIDSTKDHNLTVESDKPDNPHKRKNFRREIGL